MTAVVGDSFRVVLVGASADRRGWGPVAHVPAIAAVDQFELVDTGETVDADAPDNILVNGTLPAGGLMSFHVASVPYHGTGWRMEAHGTEGTLVATSAALPQITPVSLRVARGDGPLAQLEVPDDAPAGLSVPAGPGHNIARSYARMATAIRDGSEAQPDFDHALALHRLLDAVQRSSDERRAIRVGT